MLTLWYGWTILELKEDISRNNPGYGSFSAASELGSPIMHDFASLVLVIY